MTSFRAFAVCAACKVANHLYSKPLLTLRNRFFAVYVREHPPLAYAAKLITSPNNIGICIRYL